MNKDIEKQSGVGILENPEENLHSENQGENEDTMTEIDTESLLDVIFDEEKETEDYINNGYIERATNEGASPNNIQDIEDAGIELLNTVHEEANSARALFKELNTEIAEIISVREYELIRRFQEDEQAIVVPEGKDPKVFKLKKAVVSVTAALFKK